MRQHLTRQRAAPRLGFLHGHLREHRRCCGLPEWRGQGRLGGFLPPSGLPERSDASPCVSVPMGPRDRRESRAHDPRNRAPGRLGRGRVVSPGPSPRP